MILPFIVPLTIGAIPVGIVLGCIVYVVARSGVEAYQAQRRNLLAERVLLRGGNIGVQIAPEQSGEPAAPEISRGDAT
jgi:hypothetical protein